jgi:hypothetical protein
MKKTYVAPTVALAGNVIRETLGGVAAGSESPSKFPNAGSLGFHL